MVPMDSFYRIFFYPIIFILSPFLANHITSCLGFGVDMVSIIFALSLSLFNNSLATFCLGGTAINIYRNHDGFCIGSALVAKLMLMWRREERREMITWLLCKHQAGHGCIGSGGPK